MKELATPSEKTMTLNSLEMCVVRSDEITVKEKRDLSDIISILAGARSIPTAGSDAQIVLTLQSNSNAPIHTTTTNVSAVAKEKGHCQ